MRTPDRRTAELNEIRWWSRWARLRWRGEGYVFTSDSLKVRFFNRAGALGCRGVGRTAAWAEKVFASAGMDSTFLAFDSCASAKALTSSGYEKEDTMTVLRSAAPLPDQGSEGVVAPGDPDTWTATYLRAFYGDEGLAGWCGPWCPR